MGEPSNANGFATIGIELAQPPETHIGYQRIPSVYLRTNLGDTHKTVLTEILAEKLRDIEIDVNSFNPGPVKSDIGRNMSFPLKPIFQTVSLFFPRQSKSGVYVSTSDEVKGVTGQFFNKEKPTPLNFEKAYKDQLWAITEKTVERVLS